ncbi:MAG: membrane protein insertase YidC [Gemmatimonadales bacterium]
MLVVAVLPSLLLPPKRGPIRPDSLSVSDTVTPPARPESEAIPVRPSPAAPTISTPVSDTTPGSERRVVVTSPRYRFEFSSHGARLVSAQLQAYRSFAPNETGPAQLIPDDSRFLTYKLLFGSDTVSLENWIFEPSDTLLTVDDGEAELHWVARNGPMEVQLTQKFKPTEYLFDVAGSFSGGPASAGLVLVTLGPRLRLVEADSVWDYRNYAVVTKANSPERTKFGSLTDGVPRPFSGPFEWVALKSRYFVSSVLTIRDGQPRIGGAVATGGPKSGKFATTATVAVSLPAPGGRFAHQVYIGPQEFRDLARVGHDLSEVNPYGWIFRPIIRPVANFIVRILLWSHENFDLQYGWVLILFGVAVRIVLWPLNQKAMRSSMAMQAIQPEIKALQERHKQEPQRLQQETMRLYKHHGVNPLGGCLPMLLPMPVLFALFFVFRETIEFRGVPFLWLPDLSRADPLYIIPVVMGISMFVVSKIGQMGVPPNPQSKMMLYFMPVMMTVLFLKFSSGLNLYYAVSNITSVPQQWMIAKERMGRSGKLAGKKPGS